MIWIRMIKLPEQWIFTFDQEEDLRPLYMFFIYIPLFAMVVLKYYYHDHAAAAMCYLLVMIFVAIIQNPPKRPY